MHLTEKELITAVSEKMKGLPDDAIKEVFGKIQAEQKAKGKPTPSIDAEIAAVARIHNVTVLTTAQHFNLVDGQNIDNWL